MKAGTILSLCLALLVLAGGSWLLGRSRGPAPETAVRAQLVGQGQGPARQVTADGDFGDINKPVQPILVNLADLPQLPDTPGQYQQWLDGEIDLDEQHERIGRQEQALLQERARALAPDHNIQLLPGAVVPGFAGGFESMDFESHDSQTLVPPDPELAAGSGHLIAVVNSLFEIYDKSGNSLIGPLDFRTFFNAVPDCSTEGIGPFDPNVLYDEEADRYLMGVDGNGRYYCLAVSINNDPTGAWYIYPFFTGDDGNFFDYPRAGVGRDAIYLGANLFDPTPGGPHVEARVWAFDKSDLYSGQAPDIATRSLGQLYFTPQPMNLHGAAQGTWPDDGPHYFMGDQFDGDQAILFAWEDPFGSDTFTELATFDLSALTAVTPGYPLHAPQLGSEIPLQANDWRLLDLEYRNGRLWTVMTVSCNPGSGSVNCIRWAEIDPAALSVVQSGVFATPGQHRLFPDLAVDKDDNVAIGYTKTSGAMYPAAWAACRGAATPPGLFQGENQLKAGEAPYVAYDVPPNPAYRWGDYTGMTIDPDGQTFWYLGQYSKDLNNVARWGTHISHFTYDDCPVTSRTFLPVVVAP